MDAQQMGSRCPICRDHYIGGCCTALMPFSIVLLEIEASTTDEAIRKAEAAFSRAAIEMNRRRIN